jgi:hypothetical protein
MEFDGVMAEVMICSDTLLAVFLIIEGKRWNLEIPQTQSCGSKKGSSLLS